MQSEEVAEEGREGAFCLKGVPAQKGRSGILEEGIVAAGTAKGGRGGVAFAKEGEADVGAVVGFSTGAVRGVVEGKD